MSYQTKGRKYMIKIIRVLIAVRECDSMRLWQSVVHVMNWPKIRLTFTLTLIAIVFPELGLWYWKSTSVGL